MYFVSHHKRNPNQRSFGDLEKEKGNVLFYIYSKNITLHDFQKCYIRKKL